MAAGNGAVQRRRFEDLLHELGQVHQQELEDLKLEIRMLRKENSAEQESRMIEDAGNNFKLWPQWTQHEVHSMPRRLSALLRTGDSERRMVRLASQADTEPKNCMERRMIPPASKRRMTWDVCGLFVLAFDFLWIPMGVFDPPPSRATQVLERATLIYWTADIPMSFCTAYNSKVGRMVRSVRLVARRYIRTWFFLDLVLIATEWTAIALVPSAKVAEGGPSDAESAGLLRIGKLLRASRIIRSLRLLRLMKVRQLLFALQEHIDSEWMAIAFSTVFNMLALLAVNHYVACIWYFLGKSAEGSSSWVDFYEVRQRDFGARYVVSLHWSLTQFTPASMHVLPRSISEQIFSVVIIVCGLVGFSTFVSSITAAITRLRGLTSSELARSFMLRKFLKENAISHDLAGRLTRYIHLAVDLHRRKVDPKKVELLAYLSGPMQVELRKELFKPYVSEHMFFEFYGFRSNAAMSQLCFSAVSKQSLSKGDAVFSLGSQAHGMYFLVTGTLFYERPKGVKWNIKSGSEEKQRRVKTVTRGSHFSEAILWMPWFHRGTMGTLIESEVIVVDALKFREITQQHSDVFSYSKEYASRYLREMLDIIEQVGVAWDLPPEDLLGSRPVQKLVGKRGIINESDEVQAAELLQAYYLADSSESESDFGTPPAVVPEYGSSKAFDYAMSSSTIGESE